jgi:hypothetical protein
MKKMIFSLIAAMMLLGSVNSNAQRNIRNDQPRQEMRQEASRHNDRVQPRKQTVVVDRRADRKPDRVYVVNDRPRPVQVVEALPPREPRPRRVDATTNTVVAAAVGAAVGALITAATR